MHQSRIKRKKEERKKEKMKTNKKEIKTRLIDILKKCNNKDKKGVKLIFSDLKASVSGMSRTFKIHVIDKNGEMLNITWLVSQLLDCTYTNKDTMRIVGCGMDMLFETCYQINTTINQLNGKKYDHETAYHGFVNTRYDLL